MVSFEGKEGIGIRVDIFGKWDQESLKRSDPTGYDGRGRGEEIPPLCFEWIDH
jgi:hypothetical protein